MITLQENSKKNLCPQSDQLKMLVAFFVTKKMDIFSFYNNLVDNIFLNVLQNKPVKDLQPFTHLKNVIFAVHPCCNNSKTLQK